MPTIDLTKDTFSKIKNQLTEFEKDKIEFL